MRSGTLVVAGLMAALALGACSQMGGKAELGPAEQARAQELFDALTAAHKASNWDAAASAASELVNQYPRFARMDEALLLAGQTADARERYAEAAAYYDRLSADYKLSSSRAPALRAAAADYAKLDDPVREASSWLELMKTPLDAASRDEISRRLRHLVDEELSQGDLDALYHDYPDSPLARGALYKQARMAYAAGDYDRSYELVGRYLDALPRGESDPDARRLLELATERRQAPPPGPTSRVRPDRVGLLLPQTGSLALYGRLFEQGAKLAVDEFNKQHSRRVSLAVADSRGGAIDAVMAVRRLTSEEGAVAIVGDVFTLPAIAGAIEANAWRAPIVSPVVASDELVQIGPWVFQTRVPGTVEATAVAEAAVTKLSLERVAVIAPSRGDRRDAADFFSEEVKRLGRQVVAIEYFEDGATDFRPQLERIREAAPDALFAVGSVEELLQMLPQAKFHDVQVQMLGLSQWNSDKLMRLARAELEGAVFPAESHYGSTRKDLADAVAKLATPNTTDASPVSIAGYYGTRAVLQAIGEGAASREDVRAYLEKHLRGDAETRAARAAAVPLVRVRAGRVEPFE
ncbi:MAG TPA: ABC transporter substrate-binding protein [Candidatus Krumholzibacteria bacterium]|nr:ABC transporter substrate-binding protein [Candidatus Krumholzibacteria bacterium]